MNLKQFLKGHLALIIPYSLLLLLSIVALFLYSKIDIHMYINKLNSPFFDLFFKYFTLFGTFTLIAPIIIYLAFIRYRYAFIATASSLLAVLITQIMKRLIYYDSLRPSVVFKGIHDLHLVENVQLLSNHSFPSGHSSGAFALFVVIALINKRPMNQFLILMMAVMVGYSRIYLSQHFLIDVVVGSLIGTFSAFVCYFWLFNKKESFLDKSIFSSFQPSKN